MILSETKDFITFLSLLPENDRPTLTYVNFTFLFKNNTLRSIEKPFFVLTVKNQRILVNMVTRSSLVVLNIV